MKFWVARCLIGLSLGTLSFAPLRAAEAQKVDMFSASVESVDYVRTAGRAIVTLTFDGDAFGEDYLVAIARSAEETDCGMLLDDLGRSYKATGCLPALRTWYGNGGVMIKPATTSRFTLIFNVDPASASPGDEPTRFTLSLPFQLLKCETTIKTRRTGRGMPNGYDAGCAYDAVKVSQENFYFRDIEAHILDRPQLQKTSAKADPPYPKPKYVTGGQLPVWTKHPDKDIVTAQFAYDGTFTNNVTRYRQCSYVLNDLNSIGVLDVTTGYRLQTDLAGFPDLVDEARQYRLETWLTPKAVNVKSMFGRDTKAFAGITGFAKFGEGSPQELRPLLNVGPGASISRWVDDPEMENLPSIKSAVGRDFCFLIARSIPGDDPLSGTIRTIVGRVSMNILY